MEFIGMDFGWTSVLKCTRSVSEGSVRERGRVGWSVSVRPSVSVRVCVTNVSVRVSAIGSGSVRVCVRNRSEGSVRVCVSQY